jgi:hypothetical protein
LSAPASQLIAAKQQIFARYATELAGLPAVRFQHEAPWATATRWMTTIVTDPEETGLTAAGAAGQARRGRHSGRAAVDTAAPDRRPSRLRRGRARSPSASAAMSWAWNRIAITCGRSCGD